jgi:hypothetical protein
VTEAAALADAGDGAAARAGFAHAVRRHPGVLLTRAGAGCARRLLRG